jgi:CRP/FNR family transcriptional regulator
MAMHAPSTESQIDKAALLRGVPLFGDLGDDEVAALAGLSRVCVYPAGSEIIEEGGEVFDEDDGLYLLVGGMVEVRKDSTDGHDGRLLAEFGPGDFFGELALLDEEPRSASVFSTSEVQCLVLSRWDFWRCLRANPSIATRMLVALARRLRRTSNGQS